MNGAKYDRYVEFVIEWCTTLEWSAIMRIMEWENERCPSSVCSSIAIGFEDCIRIAIMVQSYSIILLLNLPPELW